MPDIFTKAKRSAVMARIRSRGNRDTELALVRVFRAQGITGWRRHMQLRNAERGVRKGGGVRKAGSSPRVPRSALRVFSVRPDFVFPKLRVAVFVDGCFWHACPQHATQPKGNAAFWRAKLARNQARDRRVTRSLRRAGWRVLRIWEHSLRWATRKQMDRSTPRPSPSPRSRRRGEVGRATRQSERRTAEEARLVARLRACLKTGRGPAVRDFGAGQGGETGASPQRAVMVEPTQASAKSPRRPEGFRGQGHLAALLLRQRPLRVSSVVAPCHLAFPTKTGPLPVFRQALRRALGRVPAKHAN